MTVKTTVAEFKRFWYDNEFWPENGDTYLEEDRIAVNGAEAGSDFDASSIADDAQVSIICGYIVSPAVGPEDQTLEKYFKRWRKKQSTTHLAVECDTAKRSEIVAAIKAMGGKVLN